MDVVPEKPKSKARVGPLKRMSNSKLSKSLDFEDTSFYEKTDSYMRDSVADTPVGRRKGKNGKRKGIGAQGCACAEPKCNVF